MVGAATTAAAACRLPALRALQQTLPGHFEQAKVLGSCIASYSTAPRN
jgi:hypothetical protein